jgi:glycerophosphoryl diester phosphodiesterase
LPFTGKLSTVRGVKAPNTSQGGLFFFSNVLLVSFAAMLLAQASAQAAASLWNFDNAGDRLAASSGPGVLTYHDPDATGWGPANSAFGKASSFGLPAMTGGDADVMRFPACTGRQGYRIAHGGAANGPYGETAGKISNYTLIMDVLYPGTSDGVWRSLYQTDTNNASDGELYVRNAPGGGIGIINVYNGSVRSNTWHRIALVMQSAPGEGKCQRFIDGQFVGGIGSTGSGLDVRWALDQAFLLFADNDGETATGYVSSVYFVDRAMTMEEVQALGGAHAAGAATAGAAAPPLSQQMSRYVGAIGHRGGDFCCAPDNTMAAVRRAITNKVPVIEIDTRLSADGVCVLVHDSTVDRTTDGTGAVSSMTVAQLQALDAGSWFSPEFAGEKIPTAAEVMAEAKGKMVLYFDLKIPGQIDAITNALAQTGFNPDDCWFWVYNNSSDAAQIRSRLPNAKIIWEAPSNWATTPGFFNTMRSIGVWGFDQGTYYGTASAPFVRAAKLEGFMVSVYTILDPDTMVRNAAAGVDFMETDFPKIMNAIQPPRLAAASGPVPANGATGIALDPALSWVVASNATAHRVYFGTATNPPFVREQTIDIAYLSNLTASTTYYWRIDEVTPSGVVTGAVWNFTTITSSVPVSAVYEWTFDGGNLAAALGKGTLTFADATTAGVTTFGTTGGGVPHIGGQPASFMHVPVLNAKANGYFVRLLESGPNGGGAYINRYTVIMDLLVPGSLNWTALFNTDPNNNNDADWYVAPDGRVGIADLGYSAVGSVVVGTWYRVAFAADLGAGVVRYHKNGAQIFQRTGASLIDGRYSLYSTNDTLPALLLFNEGDTSGNYTHELYLAGIAVVDRALGTNEIAALGGPNAEGIFVRRLHLTRNGPDATLNWNGTATLRLQKATTLTPPNWQDVPGTLGATNYNDAAPGTAFYRLAWQ